MNLSMVSVGNEILYYSPDAATNSNRMDLLKSEEKAETIVVNKYT